MAYLTAAFTIVAGAAFGLGALWMDARLASSFPMADKALFLALSLVFVVATIFIVRRFSHDSLRLRKSEAALRAAHTRFHNTFEHFPLSIQVVRPDGFTTSVNRAWENLFGATLDAISDVSLLTDTALQDGNVVADLKTALEGHTVIIPPRHFRMRESWPFCSHEPHVHRWIQATICPVKDDEGRVTELILIHEDVTEQKQTLADLRAAESRFRNLFEQFPLGIQIVQPDGFTAAVNRAWETIHATTYADIEHMNLLSYPGFKDNGVAEVIRAALEGQVIHSPPLLHDMADFGPFTRHAPGVKLWIKGTVCPLKDDEGRVIELITVLDDVTQQKLAADAHNESEIRKSAIVETALDCIISIDADGCVIEWNPAAEKTFGYKREAAMGQLLADLIIPPQLQDVHAHGLKRYMETGKGVAVGRHLEVTAMRAGGAEFPAELTITPIVLGERRIFSGFLRDLTKPKAAEAALLAAHSELETRVEQRTVELRDALEELQTNYERLKSLESLRDALTGMIVHDLRTPLNSMLFGLQTVPMLGAVTPPQQECLNVFALGCKDSLAVINDLLDIGKMESGLFSLHLEESTPGEVVTQALQRFAMMGELKKLHLSAQIEPDLPPLFADQEKLQRLLGNLLGNAIKFVPSGGTITLGTGLSPDESSIHFWVRDDGVGIPPEAFQRIFEKFGQAELPLGSRETSSGLGLAFCKMIVEAHGGRIWVESQPGEGSLFTATFPLLPLGSRPRNRLI